MSAAEVLAEHWWQSRGMRLGSPDTCSCGAETHPERGEEDPLTRRARAFAQHQEEMLREAGLLAVAPKARIEAMCRLLESEGHMTPVATMQIVKLWEVP